MIDSRQMAFLSHVRALARVKGNSVFKLNETDISVVCEIAKAHPRGIPFREICDLVSERERTPIFRSLQRMQESGVLSRVLYNEPGTNRKYHVYTLGPNAESQVSFWADTFDAAAGI